MIFAAKWAALCGLPRVLRQRRQVQQTRRVSAWNIRRAMATGWFTPYLRGGLWKELLGRWRGIAKPAGHGDKQ